MSPEGNSIIPSASTLPSRRAAPSRPASPSCAALPTIAISCAPSSFLYVCYCMILAAIPMGVLYAFDPNHAQKIALGLGAWLAAIPDPVWQLFTVGYLGYTGGRSWEKIKGVSK
jgi:Holin of 3TMs, for gene-transfer release